jgi:hypothetical protein
MALHKVGRPPRHSEHTTTSLSIRFTDAERSALNEHSAAQDKPIAVLLREAAEAAGLLTPLSTKPATKKKR